MGDPSVGNAVTLDTSLNGVNFESSKYTADGSIRVACKCACMCRVSQSNFSKGSFQREPLYSAAAANIPLFMTYCKAGLPELGKYIFQIRLLCPRFMKF